MFQARLHSHQLKFYHLGSGHFWKHISSSRLEVNLLNDNVYLTWGILLLVSTNCVTCTCVIRRCADKFNVYASMNRVQRCYYGVGDVFVNRFIREITYICVRVLLLKTSLTKDVHTQRVGRGILLLLVDYCPLSIPYLCSHRIITRDYFFLCKLILSFITPTSCVNVRKAYRITGGHTNTGTCIQKDPRSRSVC